jgi:hypothetical protein
MKRIEIGELVELSSAGNKLEQNNDVKGMFGMVVEYLKHKDHPYQIEWYKLDGTTKPFPMSRYEIKRFRGAK